MMAASDDGEPILASWKISEVLKRYPQLLDVLVELSPAFGKLRNPVLRRVQTRLVTVAQAAGIAGIDPARLTRDLNRAVGITGPDGDPDSTSLPEPDAADERPAWLHQVSIAQELDVRPLMARGEEPFKAIMAAARGVPVGSALRLQVGFEPLPLYDALARQGFSHWSEPRADDEWNVVFYRDRASGGATTVHAVPGGAIDWTAAATAEVTIDVRELVPPEPMIKILQALETLPDGSSLLVHHVRRPIHLYTRLDEMGYAHDTRELDAGGIDVLIQKRAEAPTA